MYLKKCKNMDMCKYVSEYSTCQTDCPYFTPVTLTATFRFGSGKKSTKYQTITGTDLSDVWKKAHDFADSLPTKKFVEIAMLNFEYSE